MHSDSDSETNDPHTLTINEHFAKAFKYKNEKEELAKLKEKYEYGSDYSEPGSSSAGSEDSEDTEEDTDGEELTPAVDAAILRTLARIRKKDPAIYEGGRRVFEEEHMRTQDKAPVAKPTTKEKSKPLTIREAAFASVFADADALSRSPSPRPLTHTEEQALLCSETRAAFNMAIDSGAEGDDDDLLIPRSRTRDEIELEEEEYKTFLEREVGEDLHNFLIVDTNEPPGAPEDVEAGGDGDSKPEGKKKGKREREKETAQGKKTTKTRDKTFRDDADQEFLINYIFNRGWIDRSNRRVPTYNEIVASSSKRMSAKSQADSDVDQNADDDEREVHGATLSDENSFDDLADAFETSYNFRFEEPGGALITFHPRNLQSVRRESTTRKDARARKKERREEEKQLLLAARREEIRKERTLIEAAVAEEEQGGDALVISKDTPDKKKSKKQQRKRDLARLKALESNELQRKLEMVNSEGGLGGIDDEAIFNLDLDADWDPSKHDARMAELYGGDDIVDDNDGEKPVWDDDINIDGIEPPANSKSESELKKRKKKEKKNKKADVEDVGVDADEMDADIGTGDGWDDDGQEWRGTEEERKRKVDAYMDEVVNRLGFSGITSHMPTRFHYTSVAPESYGLTPAEILLATDMELNSYVGLKKLAPYRVDRGGKTKKNWDPRRVEHLKEFRERLRSRVGSRCENSWSLAVATNTKNASTGAQGEGKKRKGKKERAKLKAAQDEKEDGMRDDGNNATEVVGKSQKRNREPDVSSHPLPGEAAKDVEDGALKKRRRRHKKGWLT